MSVKMSKVINSKQCYLQMDVNRLKNIAFLSYPSQWLIVLYFVDACVKYIIHHRRKLFIIFFTCI